MAHPATLQLGRASTLMNEISSEKYMNRLHGRRSMGHSPLTLTLSTQTGLDDKDGRGNRDCQMMGLGGSNVAPDTNAQQPKGKLGADDQLSQEEALHVLLSLKTVEPENAAWVMPAQPDSTDEEYPAFPDYAAPPRKVNRRKQKHGRSRSSSSWPHSSSQRPHGGGCGTGQVCDNCGTTETPLWRKLKGTDRVNCNACGIFFNTTGRVRDPTAKRTRGVVKKSSPDKVKPRNAAAGHLASLTRRSSQRLRHAATRQTEEEDMLHDTDARTSGLEAAVYPPAMPGLPRPQNLSLNNASHPVATTHRQPGFTKENLPPSYYHVMGQLMRSAVAARSAF